VNSGTPVSTPTNLLLLCMVDYSSQLCVGRERERERDRDRDIDREREGGGYSSQRHKGSRGVRTAALLLVVRQREVWICTCHERHY